MNATTEAKNATRNVRESVGWWFSFVRKDSDQLGRTYSILRVFGWMTTDQIVHVYEKSFGWKLNWQTARRYRAEYERNEVDMVVHESHCRKLPKGGSAPKSYVFLEKPETIPFRHFLALAVGWIRERWFS